MKIVLLLMIIGLLGSGLLYFSGESTADEPKATPLGHMVYFKLKDDSAAAQQKLVDACQKYLTGHDGTLFFAAGTLVKDLDRPVNNQDWHVALHLVFESRAAHDAYQVHPRHKQFIEESKDNWESVKVFDSNLATTGK